MPVPDDYKNIMAHKDAIEKAREVKEDKGLTWTEYVEKSAEAIAG